MSSTKGRTLGQAKDQTIYLYDEETKTYIPYKRDYSATVPITGSGGGIGKRTVEGPKKNRDIGVIVSLVKQRPNAAGWVQLATIASQYPRINVFAVVNPSLDRRGVGESGIDQEYLDGIKFLQYNGVIVLGYVVTTAGLKPLDDAEREIDRWRQWYPDVTGLYYDEMPLSKSEDMIQYYQELDDYAKREKGFLTTVGNLAVDHPVGVAYNNTAEAYLKNTTIDMYVMYESVGYPTEAFYANSKTSNNWIQNYPRSRFAFIVKGIEDYNQFDCQNFIDKCVGIEKLAGYVYVNTAISANDKSGFSEWYTLSPLTETAIHQLDRIAKNEGIPFSKGVVPESKKIVEKEEIIKQITQMSPVITEPKTTVSEENPTAVSDADIITDKNGVRMIYPTKQRTTQFDIDERYQFIESDGCETFDRDDFKNVEITGYFKFLNLEPDSFDYLMHMWTRNKAYGVRFMSDGSVMSLKRDGINVRGITQATNDPLSNRWIGLKTVVYNYQTDDEMTRKQFDAVRIEFWVDDNVTDQSGDLVVRNNWKRLMVVSDEGGWFSLNEKEKSEKKITKNGKVSKKPITKRTNDKILSEEKGTVVWDWSIDNVKLEVKYVSVREITGYVSD